jgi:small subunit ribosomal protein S5
VKATVQGLQSLRRPREVAELRGKTVHEILGLDDKRAGESTDAQTAPVAVAGPAAGEEQ